MSSRTTIKGLTLTEVLIAAGIVAVLAVLVVSITGPAREGSRQALCASNLVQLHQAAMLYTHDYDDVEDFPGLGPLSGSAVRGAVTSRYLRDRSALYCPDLPPAIKPRLGTSYRFLPVAIYMDLIPSPGESAMLAAQRSQMEKLGTSFPMWICDIHDEVYYQPQDGYVDDMFRQEYVVEISVAGKVYRGRRPYSRGRTISAFE